MWMTFFHIFDVRCIGFTANSDVGKNRRNATTAPGSDGRGSSQTSHALFISIGSKWATFGKASVLKPTRQRPGTSELVEV